MTDTEQLQDGNEQAAPAPRDGEQQAAQNQPGPAAEISLSAEQTAAPANEADAAQATADDLSAADEAQSAGKQNEQAGASYAGPGADLVLELNFVPSWARRPPDAARFKSSTGEDERRGRRDWDPRRADSRGGERRPRRPDERGGRPGPGSDRGRGPGRRQARGDRPRDQGRDQRRDAPPPVSRPDRPQDLGISVRFIPSREQLAAVIRQIRTSNRAYPLLDTAALFLGKLSFCHVVIEGTRGENDKAGPVIFQCKACKTLSLDKQALVSHIVSEHLADYFEKMETETEPPTGKFDFVARCGFSGILLGPPNHHSYNEKVKEVHRERFSNMSLEAYRRRIQIVREPELIEQWKQASCKRTMYKPRNMPEGGKSDPVDPAAAEAYMFGAVVPQLVLQATRIVCPMDVAPKIPDERLIEALRWAWDREGRNPFSLMLALRGACKGGRLHMFKTSRSYSFVTAIRPLPLDPDKAIESIRGVLNHLKQCPGCTRKELVDALKPGVPADSPEINEILSPLRWLIERGHIIEFFNGTLAVPLGRSDAPPKKAPAANA